MQLSKWFHPIMMRVPLMPHVEMFENWLNSCLIAHFQVSAFFSLCYLFPINQMEIWSFKYYTGILCTYWNSRGPPSMHLWALLFRWIPYTKVPTSDQLSLPKLIQTMAKLFPQNVQTLEINTMDNICYQNRLQPSLQKLTAI